MSAPSGLLTGTLSDFPIDAVLAMLAQGGRSGTLRYEGAVNGEVRIRAGRLATEAEQTDATLVDSLFWLSVVGDGRFTFSPVSNGETQSCDDDLPVEPLLQQVREQVTEWREISRSVPSLEAVLTLRPAPGAVAMTAAQWEVARHVDGTRTVHQLVVAVGSDAMSVCRNLHNLVAAGLAELDHEA